MILSLRSADTLKKKYKCPCCVFSFIDFNSLCDHVKEMHSDKIPNGVTVKQYIFNMKYKKTHGSCVIDKRLTLWNEEKNRYERYCSEECRTAAGNLFKKNALIKLGTDNPATDPNFQINAIKGRKTSGMYTFKDGKSIGYSSSYEMNFLNFIDIDMGITSTEVEQCSIIFTIVLDDKERYHIPDYYMPDMNLVIQIKDGSVNPNMNSHIQNEGRLRQKIADKSIIDDGNYNYIKIVNNEFINFVNIMRILKDMQLSDNVNRFTRVICIPE